MNITAKTQISHCNESDSIHHRLHLEMVLEDDVLIGCHVKKRNNDEMTVKQAERIIETYDNASRNGEEWAHDVFLHRGTEKYERCVATLNEAFRLKEIKKMVQQLPNVATTRVRRRTR